MRSVGLIRIELLLILAAVCLVALATDQLAIKVTPRVLFAGGALRLTCHVPRDPNNRLLEYGIINYRERSQRQLDGDHAPITWQMLMEKIPCGSGPAYCAVVKNDSSSELVRETFELVGCEP